MLGNKYEFSRPIRRRFDGLISSARNDVAVKLFGDNTTVLSDAAEEIAAALQKGRALTEVKIEQTSGLPVLTINMDRYELASHRVCPAVQCV